MSSDAIRKEGDCGPWVFQRGLHSVVELSLIGNPMQEKYFKLTEVLFYYNLLKHERFSKYRYVMSGISQKEVIT